MIPLTLQLKNFLSYGETPVTVDFAPHHLMCLSGKNGHGKSALLDAMTWAVWGQARKIGGVPRDDMRLMRLGQRHMLVIFDFSCGAQQYRVKREMTISHEKAYSTLDFGLFDAQTHEMVPLTEKTIRLTQQKIETMIGFTYESFINSVFLRQGQSNEFSKKTARERKEVLSSILGLDRYERARAWVLERVRKDLEARGSIEQLCARLTSERAREEEVRASLQVCQHEMQACVQQHEQVLVRLEQARQQRDAAALRMREIQAAQAAVTVAQEQVRSYVLSRQLVGTQQRGVLDVERASLVQQQRAAAEKQRMVCEQLEALTREQDRVTLLLQQAHKQQQGYQKDQVRIQAAQRLWEKRKALYHKMVGYAHWVNRELAEGTARRDQAADQQPVCPLCEQVLKGDRQQFLCAKLERQHHFYEQRLARVSRFLRTTRTCLECEQRDLQAWESHVQTYTHVQAQAESAQQRKLAIEEQGIGLRAALAHARESEQQCVCRLAEIDQVARRNETHDTGECDAQYQALQARLQQAEQQLAHVQIEQIPVSQETITVLEREARETDQRRQVLLQQQGGLERDMQVLAQVRAELAQQQAALARLDIQIAEQKLIADAFGKDGVQALLIEAIIPELESEANALLSRLTEHTTQVFIESLRDLKKGGARETLDINIADTVGVRPYELFSGGEAFRIDFALRVAISKLLARRAGAHLQTLIIDEGFGSQDEDGLALIMDALYRVQEDFAKIIIVSHLTTLKEQFPVQFIVEKGAQGSCIRVVEQG